MDLFDTLTFAKILGWTTFLDTLSLTVLISVSTWEALIHLMLICEVNNMRNFGFQTIMKFNKKKNIWSLFLNPIFTIFKNNKIWCWCWLLATTLSPLGLAFFNIIDNLVFFLFSYNSSCLMTLKRMKMIIEILWI
jgi:hypothetical protein